MKDSVEVRIELASQLGPLSKTLIKDFNHYDSVLSILIPLLDSMLEDKNQEILKAACGSSLIIAESLNSEDRARCILTLILRILHDDEEETRIKALTTLKSLIPLVDSDVCECFIMKEAMMLATENVVKVRKAVAECVPRLCNTIQNPASVDKLLFTFRDLVKDSIWGVRKACAENICELFEGLKDTSKNLFVLALFLDLLKDKSNNVKQCIWLQLGPCIYNCKVTVPEEMVEAFLALSSNSSNKGEFQFHFSYYFPAVLEKLGKMRWETLRPGFLTILKEADLKAKKSLLLGFHEIAKILGISLASEELTGIYENVFSENAATKQLALNGLSRFLSRITLEKRGSFVKFLKVLHKFSGNWRIRLSVAEQLKDLVDLFQLSVVLNDFYPIVMSLLADKVSKIREAASIVLGKIVFLAQDSSHQVLVEFRDLSSGSWTERLSFISACSQLHSLLNFPEVYGEEFEALCEDKTVNVRIACARIVKQKSQGGENFWKRLENKLSHDFDADVRFEVSGSYDLQRGVDRLRPNSDKDSTLSTPMFRALFRDEDVDEIINFRPEAFQLFGYLKAAVAPDVSGFVEFYAFDVALKAKMMIDL
jgi:serine/threonine-protein phosphatase 4 regulatory subunit 1